MSDKELTDLLKSNPHKGLEAVIKQYTPYLWTIAKGKLGDICSKEDMEEAVSDVFMLFFKSGKECDFEFKSLRAYISVIAKRHFINMFNARVRKGENLPLDELTASTAENECFSRDEREWLIGALKSLGEPDCSIFLRKFFFGQKSAEIAQCLGMKPNTVDKRISRGLKRLRQILEED
jgi:RNA polymerase sigma-70 factor (ECF subfamily)